MTGLEFAETQMKQLEPLIFEVHSKIWKLAELSDQEYQSAELLCQVLETEGFTVRKGVSGKPTAFIASYGAGHPAVGYLGEYDALPGLSQQAGTPYKCPVKEQAPGHGCGHSALGTASLAAALIAKGYLEKTGKPGRVVYYGCCSEESVGVKPFMARDGEFDDIDCVYAWHPASTNGVLNAEFIAVKDFIVEFQGTAAHAGGSPHLGRSALDACELMNVGVNYLREHVIQEARLQYAYLDAGGIAPNIVQDHAKLIYGIRAPKIAQVREIAKRVIQCAEGAALMTGTTYKITPNMGYSDVFQNKVAAHILSDAAQEVGAPQWDEADYELARQFTAQYNDSQRAAMEEMIRDQYPQEEQEEKVRNPLDTQMAPFEDDRIITVYGCSDVGDVGYVAPTASLSVATAALGCPGHSWFMTGMTGSSIGEKGIACAAKIMGLAGIKVYDAPSLLDGAQEERLERTGGIYECPMETI